MIHLLPKLRLGPPKKRWFAVLVGIQYMDREEDAQLNHPHDDVDRFKELLLSVGYRRENMRILADREGDIWPTRENIIKYLKWLAQHAVEDPNHTYKLRFFFAGHGVQVPDLTGKEKDGKTEAIVPVDVTFDMYSSQDGPGRVLHMAGGTYQGLIMDYELRNLLAEPLPPNTNLIGIFDMCTAGTLFNLQYEYIADNIPPGHKRMCRLTRPRPLKVVGPTVELKKRPIRKFSLPVQLPITSALGFDEDLTVSKSVNLVSAVSVWTLESVKEAWYRLSVQMNGRNTLAIHPDTTTQAASLNSGRLSPIVEEAGIVPMAVDVASAPAARGSPLRTRTLDHVTLGHERLVALMPTMADFAQITPSDDEDYIAAEVLAIGGCSDGEPGDDRRSLAKALVAVYRSYDGKLTIAELFQGISWRLERLGQHPEITSSRELQVTKMWSTPFIL